MPALAPTTRFFHAGTAKVHFLPAIAAADLTPTRAEINAGTDLTSEIADMSGWLISAGVITTPDLGSDFDNNIPGKVSVDTSTLTFYQDIGGADVRTTLPRGTNGFILVADGGDAAGKKADVFPVRVASIGKTRSVGEESARQTITFAITRKPAENVTLPA